MSKHLCFLLNFFILGVNELALGVEEEFVPENILYLEAKQLRIPATQPTEIGKLSLGIISLKEHLIEEDAPYTFLDIFLYSWAVDEIRKFLAEKPEGDFVIEVDYDKLYDVLAEASPHSLKDETIVYLPSYCRKGFKPIHAFRWVERSSINPDLLTPVQKELKNSQVRWESSREITCNSRDVGLIMKTVFTRKLSDRIHLQSRVILRIQGEHSMKRLKLNHYRLGRLALFALALARNSKTSFVQISQKALNQLVYLETDDPYVQISRRMRSPHGIETYDRDTIRIVRKRYWTRNPLDQSSDI